MAGLPNTVGPYPNYNSVEQLLAAFYGGAFVTLPHETDYTIGTAVVAINSNRGLQRIGATLSNTGSTNIAVSFSAAVTITTGVLLLPGGTFNLDWYYDGDLCSRILQGISSAAGGTLHMIERFLVGA